MRDPPTPTMCELSRHCYISRALKRQCSRGTSLVQLEHSIRSSGLSGIVKVQRRSPSLKPMASKLHPGQTYPLTNCVASYHGITSRSQTGTAACSLLFAIDVG